MVLKMILDGKLIGVSEVEPNKIKTTGYLRSIREALRQKYKAALARCVKQPTFLLEIPTDNS